jgi:TonB family protein
MTMPARGARPARTAPAQVNQAPDDARGRTPTKGAQVTAGSAVAVTGARGQGFGLSSGGGAGSGLSLDVANFCCPDYLTDMMERIRQNWNSQSEVTALAVVKFSIERNGSIRDVALERSSGYAVLDLNAQRAVVVTRQLAALPADYTNPTLTMHLHFDYRK